MEPSTSISSAEAKKAFEYIKRRSKTDSEFRQKLLDTPREVLEAELDIALPEDFDIRFVENMGADLTVVLPDRAEPNDELSDDDLDHVAGGAVSGASTLLEKISHQRDAHESDSWATQLTS